VLQFLLMGDEAEGISSKADCEEVLKGRVKGLRDVVEVKFELDNEGGKPRNEMEGRKEERWICPVTHKTFGSNVKAVYLVPCGHAFSEEAIREMKTEKCLQCNEGYLPENIIPILPTKESEKERLISRMQSLNDRGLTHSLKKSSGSSKKRKKNGGNTETSASEDTGLVSRQSSSTPTPSLIPRSSTPQSTSISRTATPTGIKNAATAILTARVLEEENQRNKRRKHMGTNETLRSLFISDSKRENGKDADFMTRGFSIPSGARR